MWNGWRRGEAAATRAARRAWARVDFKAPPLPDLRRVHLPELHAPEIDWGRGRMGSRAAALWPALFAAAGAGAAVWWWNQWARGQAEAQAGSEGAPPLDPPVEPSPEDRAGGREGAATPETIMAHAPTPEPPKTKSPKAKSPPKRKGEGPAAVVSDEVRDGLDESLAVQAAAKSPKPDKPRKAKPPGAKPPTA